MQKRWAASVVTRAPSGDVLRLGGRAVLAGVVGVGMKPGEYNLETTWSVEDREIGRIKLEEIK